jgi:Ca-activated chloride channel family protein
VAVSFRDIDLLWLLALVPIAIVLMLVRHQLRERATRRFGDAKTLSLLIAGHSTPWRLTRAALFVLALAGVIVALAGPQYGSRTRWLRKQGVDIVVALDFSKSMLARDVRPSRIERAKAELVRFLDDLDGDRVGVVAFAGDTMEFPMTVDYSAVALFLRDMTPMDMPVGGTAIGRALMSAKSLLERSHRPDESEEERARKSQVVILMTDGEDHEGDPVEAAQELAAAGIQVYTVGIGSRAGEPIPLYTNDGTWTGYMRDEDGEIVTTSFSAEAEETLREVARITQGRFVRAREGGVGIAEVREHIATLHQSEQRARQVTVQEERYALVLLPALWLLILERLLPDAWITRRRRRRKKKTTVENDDA